MSQRHARQGKPHGVLGHHFKLVGRGAEHLGRKIVGPLNGNRVAVVTVRDRRGEAGVLRAKVAFPARESQIPRPGSIRKVPHHRQRGGEVIDAQVGSPRRVHHRNQIRGKRAAEVEFVLIKRRV